MSGFSNFFHRFFQEAHTKIFTDFFQNFCDHRRWKIDEKKSKKSRKEISNGNRKKDCLRYLSLKSERILAIKQYMKLWSILAFHNYPGHPSRSRWHPRRHKKIWAGINDEKFYRKTSKWFRNLLWKIQLRPPTPQIDENIRCAVPGEGVAAPIARSPRNTSRYSWEIPSVKKIRCEGISRFFTFWKITFSKSLQKVIFLHFDSMWNLEGLKWL